MGDNTEEKIPELVIPDEDIRNMTSPYRRPLVIKVLGHKVGYQVLRQQIKSLWQLSYELNPVDIGNKFFLVRYRTKEEYEKVLKEGPWMILGHYLTVRKWDPTFEPKNETITSTLAWIHFPDLPIHLFNEKTLTGMGNLIGKVMGIDKHMEQSLRYARVCVELDLNKPLIPCIKVSKKIRVVEYEGINTFCFKYGAYGHRNEACGTHDKDKENGRTKHREPQSEKDKQKPTIPTGYRPWNIIPPRPRRGTQKKAVNQSPNTQQDTFVFMTRKEKTATPTEMGNQQEQGGNMRKQKQGHTWQIKRSNTGPSYAKKTPTVSGKANKATTSGSRFDVLNELDGNSEFGAGETNALRGQAASYPNETLIRSDLIPPISHGTTYPTTDNSIISFADPQFIDRDGQMRAGKDGMDAVEYEIDEESIEELEIVTDMEAKLDATYTAKVKECMESDNAM
ncbi:hypothetical protein BUALT_Bualt08G0124800 [Buddleja alternifolia]|uniref:DUF4283 domain-containing protein n=1 Tax=Buddleja alternifolia TaxID=168488 RepID=A0AAV6XE42_9LAMI|nr:hypothetical protein BUALT_Bualt08G0124800 [Buddleja alternifolia]